MNQATSIEVIEIDDLDCRFVPRPWSFAEVEATAIETNWAQLTRANPALFNGRVLLQHDSRLETGNGRRSYHATYLETDFKSFISWRDFGYPDVGVRNCFAMAALQAADGAFLVGEMAAHTANAGRVYFPSGTPDPQDLRGDRVDLESSVRRELSEETGLTGQDVELAAGWTLLVHTYRIACMKRVRASLPADVLVQRIHDFLAREAQPELARMHVIRRPADCEGLDLPDFMLTYLRLGLAAAHSG